MVAISDKYINAGTFSDILTTIPSFVSGGLKEQEADMLWKLKYFSNKCHFTVIIILNFSTIRKKNKLQSSVEFP